MIASSPFQKAIYAALNGNVTGGVYDEPPASAVAPYTVIGEMTDVPWDTHDSDGSEETATLHVWDSQPSSLRTKGIMAELDVLLHNQTLTLEDGKKAFLRREFSTVMKDRDGATHWRHGVLRYRAFIS